MRTFDGYTRGIGIGGWLTNFKRIAFLPEERRLRLTTGDLEHFQNYITKWDVDNIASMGVDHIRLAFDQIVLEEYEHSGVYREETFACIDRFLTWAHSAGLNVILNLHKAIGCYCDCTEGKNLLDEPELQDRFVAFWLEMERRYHDHGREICFELMNEITESRSDRWNALYRRTVEEIRKRNPDRLIMIGSASWNSVHCLDALEVLDDPNVVYTFHFYEPFEFTHQRTTINAPLYYYNREMPYPCDIARYRELHQELYGNENAYPQYDRMDKRFLYDRLAPAKRFLEKHPDAILTCGEFGTIRSCRTEWRENWFADVIAFLDENGIPFTIWNYLSTPYDCNRFSLVDDDHRALISSRIAALIRKK